MQKDEEAKETSKVQQDMGRALKTRPMSIVEREKYLPRFIEASKNTFCLAMGRALQPVQNRKDKSFLKRQDSEVQDTGRALLGTNPWLSEF